ncbi:hypothetical protein OHA37_35845 [Streptomyces sp. NBC_00335]|uniref:hypothetical protein n=1 Tax=unclassified Streptomyces TaxID=2593676 RepID=UPI00224D245A|nr:MULTISPECIES: hypothetical protein [unclassified Streptomyces]MCX5409215.1 hypothetical protein [Streptomyces sp. NBC_00086]
MRIRIAFQAVLTAVGLILLSPAVAHAHGDTVKVVVTGQRDGHVTADVTWENDGDAVEEAVAATVNAVSADGARTLGPWRLVRDPAATPAGWTTTESLPPGAWKVSVDVGFPALGHGELEVGVPVVDPAPTTGTPGTRPAEPSSAPTGTQAQPPTPTPATASETPAEPGTGPAVWWTTAGVAATALAGAAVGIFLRRRRAA